MAVGGLHVEDGVLGLGARLTNDLEELAPAVGLHVQGDDARYAAAPVRTVSDLEPSADPGELGVEEVRVHEGEDTITVGRVHRFLSIKWLWWRIAADPAPLRKMLEACKERGPSETDHLYL